MIESYTEEEKKLIKVKEPDIAFWFSEEDTRYLVEIRNDISHLDLIMAAFDLLAKAIKSSDDMKEMEYER